MPCAKAPSCQVKVLTTVRQDTILCRIWASWHVQAHLVHETVFMRDMTLQNRLHMHSLLAY